MTVRRQQLALPWVALLIAAPLITFAVSTSAQVDDQGPTIPRIPLAPLNVGNLPRDLRAVPVPGPSNLSEFVRDEQAARILGKALFWDMQVGSDGVQACASCHFRAGADPRSKNQLSPGLRRVAFVNGTAVPNPDVTYTTSPGPNGQLTELDFPLSRLLNPGLRGSGFDPLLDSNDAVSSQGVHHLGDGPDPDGFMVGGLKTRRVEPRNTPSVINAVFNHRQFWDGRAENVFNGVNHVGQRDKEAKVYRADNPQLPKEVTIVLLDSSLASQAVAPIVSALEMSAPGRTPQDVGRDLAKTPRTLFKRIQQLRPLAKQQVHPTDSILGGLSRFPQKGLAVPAYDDLVKTAFHERWWRSSQFIQVNPDGTKQLVDRADNDPATEEFTLIQYNFSLFFGLAVQMYESLLVSDDTPWDRFRRDHPAADDPVLNPWTWTDGPRSPHITRLALFGAHLFNDRTRGDTNLRCSNCHEENELTDASARRVALAKNGPVRNRDLNVIDKGFNNIGVRPTFDDLGVGAADAFGPLSFSRRKFSKLSDVPVDFDGVLGTVTAFGLEGAFKVPSLRNVALTAPYFHNGDALTLEQVIEFYSRGGNVAPVTELNGSVISPLGVPAITANETLALVAFMNALTDERVVFRRAPFDHPQLFVPNGHPTVDANGDGFADDVMIEIPAVGAQGGPPLKGFLEFGVQ